MSDVGTFKLRSEEEEDDNIIIRCISNLRSVATYLTKRIFDENELSTQHETNQKRRHLVPERPNYEESSWGKMLQDPSLLEADSKAAKLFRRRFRLPYTMFRFIVSECRRNNLFPESSREFDITGRPCIPLELKLLGVLRILGRNWCLDDVNEACGISEREMDRFFHNFCETFVRHFWGKYVKSPAEDRELEEVMSIYSKLGLPGCIGSIDCVHLKWDKCPESFRNDCKGKEGYPSLVYEVSVDHMRRIRSCTNEFWGSINDKTIVKYDDYVMAVREGKKWAEVEYKILNEKGEEERRKGVWFLCDNGYHHWNCLMPPFTVCSAIQKIYWSEWIESVRKDVECTFGILKARFRILRDGIQYHRAYDITNIFHTCCILHNMLLEYDGLDEYNEEQWETLRPQKKAKDDDNDYDENGDEIGVDDAQPQARIQQWRGFINNTVEVQEDDTFYERREILVNHFYQAYNKGLVFWPRGFKEYKINRFRLALGEVGV